MSARVTEFLGRLRESDNLCETFILARSRMVLKIPVSPQFRTLLFELKTGENAAFFNQDSHRFATDGERRRAFEQQHEELGEVTVLLIGHRHFCPLRGSYRGYSETVITLTRPHCAQRAVIVRRSGPISVGFRPSDWQ